MENAHMDAQILVRYLTPRLPAYLHELTELCGIECPSESKVGVDVAGAWVLDWAASRQWEVRHWRDASAGTTIALTLRGTGTARIILAAHLDTVYPVGIAAERPVRIDGNTLYGPGSADNKSGLLSGLYAMAALQDLGALDTFAAITLICGGDEETDMRVSRQCFADLAPHHDLALVLEAGRENGDIVSARKGGGNFWFTVTGKAAHAGVEPHKGANAIVELAHHSIALHALNGMRPGTTLNVGVVSGGTVSNSVPDQAQAKIDVRITDPADRQAVTDAILAIGARTTVPGTSTVVSGAISTPAMACTLQIARLAAVAKECATQLGFSINDAHTGGMSYANYFAELGLPVLDGLGPVGGNDHSPGEYILVDSIVPRTALLALLMTKA
jgi:glutamate carboxypeptidase